MPSELKSQISRVARQFSGYGQQDAQEFLRFLLDGMHNELNRIKKKPKVSMEEEPPCMTTMFLTYQSRKIFIKYK